MPDESRHLSRRDLLTGKLFGWRIKPNPAPARIRSAPPMPLLRPPGALPEPAFLATCTSCGDCVPACPHQAIRMAPPRFRGSADTPILDPAQAPCWMCADTPCVSACGPRALVRTGDEFPRIGTARILVMDCLAHQGTLCSSCFERCPAPGAITISEGRPTVIPEFCTGCGVCHHVCPAPRNAVMILPRQASETVPRGE